MILIQMIEYSSSLDFYMKIVSAGRKRFGVNFIDKFVMLKVIPQS